MCYPRATKTSDRKSNKRQGRSRRLVLPRRHSLDPKERNPSAKNFRPITCLYNFYKLCTKILTQVARDLVEEFELLDEAQMGTRRFVEGAKEQAKLSKSIHGVTPGTKVTWFNVYNAFDTINHGFLLEVLKRKGFLNFFVRFVEPSLKKTKLNLTLR